MSNTVKLSVAIVLLLGSGAWLSYYFKSQPKAGETVKHLQPLTCTECHHAWKAEAGDPPVECPKCKKMTGQRAAKCADQKCGAITPLVRTKRGDGAPPNECYKCKNKRLVEVPPGDIP